MNKTFYKNLCFLAIPVIIQNLIGASLNLLDNVMVGNLGEKAIAATGIANQYYLIFFNTTNGFILGAGIFLAQYWGKKDTKNMSKYLGISFLFSTVVAIIFFIGALFFAENIIGFFNKDIEIIKLGKEYLHIVSFSYLFTYISLSYSMLLRSMGYTKIPMLASIIACFFNGILNYIFIFGKFGAPQLGVAGAGIGTTVARAMELIFIMYVIYSKNNYNISLKFGELTNFNMENIKKYLVTTLPVVFNDAMWIGGLTLYFKAFSLLGTSATTTMQIANTLNNVFNIFGIGIAVAGSIIIGNTIGSGDYSLARKEATSLNYISIILGCIIGVIFFIVAPFIILLFNIEEQTKIELLWVLRIMAVVLPLRFFGILNIIGIFRGGGDVFYAIITEITAVWLIGVCFAFLGAKYFEFSIPLVYAMSCLEEPFKSLLIIPRLKSGKWIKNLT